MRKFYYFFPFLLMLFLSINFARANNVNGPSFELYIPNTFGLGFQHSDTYVLLSVTSGNLNSSNTYLLMTEYDGSLFFTANETASIEITYNVTNVKVYGDTGNDLRLISSGTTININRLDDIQILWALETPAWLPIGFIMGMVGLVSMFGGSLYLVNEVKQKNYEGGFQNGIIFIAMGIALVLVWLWP